MIASENAILQAILQIPVMRSVRIVHCKLNMIQGSTTGHVLRNILRLHAFAMNFLVFRVKKTKCALILSGMKIVQNVPMKKTRTLFHAMKKTDANVMNLLVSHVKKMKGVLIV